VDTKADPPRAIWTHPYEDEQYLKEHPDVKEKVGNFARQEESNDTTARRHSFNGHDSASMVPEEDQAQPDPSKKGKQKRGFFGKLKDRAIGTKEEREAYRKEQERVRRTQSVVNFSVFLSAQLFLARNRETASISRDVKCAAATIRATGSATAGPL
jgi:hypothetical protein